MASNRQNRGGNQHQQQQQAQANLAAATTRQNEYFVPRDGIDREVITSDICRYLGHDALVRPGTYESPDGRVTQGYYINAYRNLTSAMIQDLKADSARWEQERRAAARSSGGGPGGTMHSSQPNTMFVRSSNSPLGREQLRGSDYSSWKNRQRPDQDYDNAYAAGSAMDIDYPAASNAPKNPYAGVPYPGMQSGGAYPPSPYVNQLHSGMAAGYQAYGYQNNPAQGYAQQPQAATDRYTGMAPPPPMAGFGQAQAADPPFVHGSNYQTQPSYVTSGPIRLPPLPLASAAPSRTFPAPTSGAPGYGQETDIYGYPSVSGAGIPSVQAFPSDPHYGRGSPAGSTPARPGYGTVPDQQQQQYDDQTSASSAMPIPVSGAPSQQLPSPAQAPVSRRDGRESEPRDTREHREHRGNNPRRQETDREDRHAAEREKRRFR
ncbi:hypothetical protein B0H63DRAFT_295764 [Podospora didyma]|uniref:Transcription factor n=1 Tax=Podospora didyma TaxID=330526 RepID=A0AAE0K990_9PEZI|nr:hypothetical protein B0H63DRAFT_295764 [Podospora didyma]